MALFSRKFGNVYLIDPVNGVYDDAAYIKRINNTLYFKDGSVSVETPISPAPPASNVPYTFPVFFPGMINTTNYSYFQACFRWPVAMTIQYIYFAKANMAQVAGSGNTVAVVSTSASPPPAGSSITASLGYTSAFSAALSTGTISLTALAPLYVFFSSGAGCHSDIQLMIGVKAS